MDMPWFQPPVGGSCCLLNQLPAEMLQTIIAEHLPSPADVKALSRTCSALHGLIASQALVAAWLWSTHGAEAPFMAVNRRELSVLRRLIEVHHADVNGSDTHGETLLCRACFLRCGAFISYLLTVPGIDANKASRLDMQTPLHVVCRSDDGVTNGGDLVRQLLSHPGVQVNALDGQGRTPLALTAAYGTSASFDVVRELLKHTSVDVNAHGSTGSPPLLTAALYGHAKAAALLLQHPGINVNVAPLPEGYTCLHYAALFGHLSLARELLKHPGIDLGLRNGTGQTAHQLAQTSGNNGDVAQAIAAAMAR